MAICLQCGRDIGPAVELGGLTERQADVLTWLRRWDWSKHRSPSYEEICKGVGLKSKSGMHRLIHGLADRGFVRFQYDKFGRSRRRGIVLITKG